MKKKKKICRLALTMMMTFMLIFSSVEAAYATTLIEALSSGTVNPVNSTNYSSGKNYQKNGMMAIYLRYGFFSKKSEF